MIATRLLVAVLGLASLAGAQTASFATFGTSCTHNGLTPAPNLLTQGLPQFGTSFDLVYVGGNEIGACAAIGCTQQPVLVLGVSNQSAGPIPLPYSLGNLCPLRVSPDLVFAMPFDPQTNLWSERITIAVPNDPGLLGAQFHAQWLTADFGILLATSHGVTGTVGV